MTGPKGVRIRAALLASGLMLLPGAAAASPVPIGPFGGLLLFQALLFPLFLIGVIVLAIRFLMGRLHTLTKVLTALFLGVGLLNALGVLAAGELRANQDRVAAAVIVAAPLLMSLPGLWLWRRERQERRAKELQSAE